MKNKHWKTGAAALLLFLAGTATAVEFDIDGAVPGRWTMDLEAARQLAAEKQLPMLLDFSGSDWCGWCKVMEENVFTKPEWQSYAAENLVMVFIDFPKDKSLVPEKYIERNDTLKSEYGIRGYPTFVVLDSDGTTELGRLGSGRDKTPQSFQSELEALFRLRPSVMAGYADSLSPEKRATYLGLIDQLTDRKQQLKQAEQTVEEARKEVRAMELGIRKTEEQIRDFRVAQLDGDARQEFEALQEQLKRARDGLAEWIKTDPEKNEENMEKYKEMQAEIQALEARIAGY